MALRLPQNYIPTHYDLFIHFQKDKRPFDASVSIIFEKNQEDDKVILNVEKNINIQKITQNNVQLKYDVNYPQVTIHRSKDPEQDISSYPIKIDYQVQPLQNNYDGFYSYGDCFFTSFESHYARTMLPCFDEPCIRSSFTVRVKISSNLTGISNMPAETTQIEGNEKLITFLPTPKMCTYLLCICVGLFVPIQSNSKSGIPIKIYTKPEVDPQLFEYLNFCTFALDWMEEKTGVKYELPCLQFISHQGIQIGMENYGLIALSELESRSYLVNVLTILHEVSHLWFGDLVSIKWWDSIWLNEGFAQYFEYLMLEDSMENGKSWAIHLFIKYDGLRCLSYYDNQKIVPDESEIDFSQNLLPSIVYIKGAFVLKMFSDIVGKENFFRVCSRWLTEYKNKSVVVSDFIKTVNETLNEDYTDFFNTWLKKIGLPLLKVCENYSSDGQIKGVTITQESHTGSLYTFKLGICIGRGQNVEQKQILVKDKVTVVDCDFDWLIVNDNVDSLCAVIYSNILLSMLNEARLNDLLSDNNQSLIFLSPRAVKSDFTFDEEIYDLCGQFGQPIFRILADSDAFTANSNESYSFIDDNDDNVQYSCSVDDEFKSHSIEKNDDNNGNDNNDNDKENKDAGDNNF